MEILLNYRGEERQLDVPEGQTIAQAAQEHGMNLYGSCEGKGRCCMCSRKVRAGMEYLVDMSTGKQYSYEEGSAPYVKTCQVFPRQEGVEIDADSRARMW